MSRGASNRRPDPSNERRREAGGAFDRGWLLTPLAGKKPYLKDWSKAPPPTREDVERWAGERNIGVRTGAESGIVVIDVDRDDPELATRLGIPTTATVRTSRGRHYYLRHPGGVIKNSAGVLGEGIDVKADGGCVVLPGSVHPDTGHVYAWESGLSLSEVGIAAIPPALLERLRPQRQSRSSSTDVRLTRTPSIEFAREKLRVAAAIVASTEPGSRNDTLNRQAFLMKRFVDAGTITWSEVETSLRDAALQAGLGENEICSTLDSASRAHPLPLGAANADQPLLDQHNRPTIIVEPGALLENVAAAEQALLDFPECSIYQRGGALFRTVPDHTVLRSTRLKNVPIAYTLLIVEADWLLQEFMSCAQFARPNDAHGSLVPIDCTVKIAKSYLARVGDWKVPILNSIVSHPTLRIDGSTLENPGYDPASRLLFLPGGVSFHPVPEAPTLEDAKAAIQELIAPLAKFPFVELADRSVALSAMLTAVIRRSLPSAPAIAFRAPTMGSGKSLLTDVIAILMTGRVARAFTLGTQVDEEKKTIFAALLSGAPILAIDNVDRAVASPVMCTILTQEVWQSRVLNYSKNVTVPTDVLVILNGNNLQFDGDIITRVLPCDLDPGCERPEERKFEGDLRATVSEQRPRLIVAALTVLRAYIAAGQPKMDLTPFGRFEAWSDLVRSALVWAGEPDPCLTRKRLRQDDPVSERLGRFLSAWHEAFGSNAKTVADVAADEAAKVPELLRDSLREIAGDGINHINRRKLGQYLASFRNRWVDGLRLERDGTRSHAARWRVVKRDETDEGRPTCSGELQEFRELDSLEEKRGTTINPQPEGVIPSDSRSEESNSRNSSNSPAPKIEELTTEYLSDPEATE